MCLSPPPARLSSQRARSTVLPGPVHPRGVYFGDGTLLDAVTAGCRAFWVSLRSAESKGCVFRLARLFFLLFQKSHFNSTCEPDHHQRACSPPGTSSINTRNKMRVALCALMRFGISPACSCRPVGSSPNLAARRWLYQATSVRWRTWLPVKLSAPSNLLRHRALGRHRALALTPMARVSVT